ncbi:BTAD domain-containing putative transcriptional regulator [Nonomuraea sp. NPDC050663]|uniref:BTAD domain-containing putative transcriptional regulator n=1 Tax=Nonomuraea sp. NPDC050663 TaxID=3364370 RepID=UPI0037BC08D2
MRFGVLGPLAVWADDGRPLAVAETKVRALLADLLIHAPRPVPAEILIEDLWGDDPPRNAAAVLQARVSQLRGALGDRGLVVRRAGGYQVAAGWLDAAEFERLAAAARAASELTARADLLDEALGLWRGPVLEGLDFAVPYATRLEELRLTLIEEQAEVRLALGRAVELGAMVEAHPFRERLLALHLRALDRAGRRHEALTAFDGFRVRLAGELGVDPGPELQELHLAMIRQEPARTNLPAPLTRLVGRDAAVERVGKLLGRARLVTLVGPGGVGKTRLALASATGQSPSSPDGVWLVELAAARTAADLTRSISATLGIRDDIPLTDALRDKRTLLLLDNCEQVIDDVAELARTLLAAAPGLRILATSRQLLGLPGEARFEVEPLSEPAAAELFAERAAVEPGGIVAEICRRLDCLPLALELAATRVRALGLEELARRLDDRFATLSPEIRGLPARQRTLRAVIDWSWELLSKAERAALRRLSVFAGGCTLEAADAVGVGAEELARLADRSLVAVGPGPRYLLLESIRAYAREKLADSGEEPRIRELHHAYFVGLAVRAEPEVRGARQREWLARLDAETADFGLVRDARLADALAWYRHLRGRLVEARDALAESGGDRAWLAGMSTALGEPPDTLATGGVRASWFAVHVRWAYGDFAANLRRIEQVLERAREEGDAWTRAAALATRSHLAMALGDLAASRADGEHALAAFTELGDRWGQLEAADSLAMLAEIGGDYDQATRLREEGLEHAEELGLWPAVAFRLAALGRVALLTGDLDRARTLHERAVHLATRQSYRSALEFSEVGLGMVARRQGRLDEAETRLRRWLSWLDDVKGLAGTAFLLAELGFVAEQRGDAVTATRLQLQGLAAAEATADPRAVALAKEGLAGARSLAGEPEEATRLLAEAEALRASVGAPLPPGERGDVNRTLARLADHPSAEDDRRRKPAGA